MKLIVWLGNPWTEYRETRHNVGFLFVDYLREKWKFEDFKDSKFKWIISEWNINWEKIILLKPLTYMNLSWESVVSIMNFYKINIEDFVVIYDDLDMEFGKLRWRTEWSPGGHNGIKSITKLLWTEKYNRLKIWIWRNKLFEVSDWVLSKFSKEELENLQKEIFENAYDLLIEKI